MAKFLLDKDFLKGLSKEDAINVLKKNGASRWTKYDKDRLYINPDMLGYTYEKYKSGYVSSAEYKGNRISNYKMNRVLASNVYVNLDDMTVHSDYKDNIDIVKDGLKEILAKAAVEKNTNDVPKKSTTKPVSKYKWTKKDQYATGMHDIDGKRVLGVIKNVNADTTSITLPNGKEIEVFINRDSYGNKAISIADNGLLLHSTNKKGISRDDVIDTLFDKSDGKSTVDKLTDFLTAEKEKDAKKRFDEAMKLIIGEEVKGKITKYDKPIINSDIKPASTAKPKEPAKTVVPDSKKAVTISWKQGCCYVGHGDQKHQTAIWVVVEKVNGKWQPHFTITPPKDRENETGVPYNVRDSIRINGDIPKDIKFELGMFNVTFDNGKPVFRKIAGYKPKHKATKSKVKLPSQAKISKGAR